MHLVIELKLYTNFVSWRVNPFQSNPVRSISPLFYNREPLYSLLFSSLLESNLHSLQQSRANPPSQQRIQSRFSLDDRIIAESSSLNKSKILSLRFSAWSLSITNLEIAILASNGKQRALTQNRKGGTTAHDAEDAVQRTNAKQAIDGEQNEKSIDRKQGAQSIQRIKGIETIDAVRWLIVVAIGTLIVTKFNPAVLAKLALADITCIGSSGGRYFDVGHGEIISIANTKCFVLCLCLVLKVEDFNDFNERTRRFLKVVVSRWEERLCLYKNNLEGVHGIHSHFLRGNLQFSIFSAFSIRWIRIAA